MTFASDEFSIAREKLAKDIVGEIVFSPNPEKAIRKWRNIFKVSQKELANKMGITASVVSDYESGRRKSPGIKIIKKYINTLLDIDEENGGNVIKSFIKTGGAKILSSAVIDMREFSTGVTIDEFCRLINANLLTKKIDRKIELYGYTIIDSLKAITELSFQELIKLYGLTTQRAMIFTKVSTGRSPLVAIKIANLKPALVVIHGPTAVDEIARRIAEAENIPLALCLLEKSEDINLMLKDII